MESNYKTAQLENSVNYLMNRVGVLEDTIKDLRGNLIMPESIDSKFYVSCKTLILKGIP